MLPFPTLQYGRSPVSKNSVDPGQVWCDCLIAFVSWLLLFDNVESDQNIKMDPFNPNRVTCSPRRVINFIFINWLKSTMPLAEHDNIITGHPDRWQRSKLSNIRKDPGNRFWPGTVPASSLHATVHATVPAVHCRLECSDLESFSESKTHPHGIPPVFIWPSKLNNCWIGWHHLYCTSDRYQLTTWLHEGSPVYYFASVLDTTVNVCDMSHESTGSLYHVLTIERDSAVHPTQIQIWSDGSSCQNRQIPAQFKG